MEALIEKSNLLIRSVSFPHQRDVLGNVNWNWRMNSIVGARGTGKTTLLLQQLAEKQRQGYEVLYVRLDDLYFADHRLVDLAESFRRQGGAYLYVDETHKYEGWSKELKSIYDTMPELKVVFSGSSVIELTKQDADLSRRALVYTMPGLSFREYLLLGGIINLAPLTLQEILSQHVEIAADISGAIPVLKHFSNYLTQGYYPFFLEKDRDYGLTLEQIIRTVMETDLRVIEGFDPAQSQRMLTLLKIIASSAPFKPNISKISERTGLHRQTVLQYLRYLEQARMIRLINLHDRHISRLQKPDKILLENPNLFYVLSQEYANTGSLRETFALSQLVVKHKVTLHREVDFWIDNDVLIEIGGKNKGTKQIRHHQEAFLFVDDLLVGHQRRVPLWVLGLLY